MQFFFEIWDPMSSQYLLQYKLYEIVKNSLQFLAVEWLVFVDLIRCNYVKIKILHFK